MPDTTVNSVSLWDSSKFIVTFGSIARQCVSADRLALKRWRAIKRQGVSADRLALKPWRAVVLILAIQLIIIFHTSVSAYESLIIIVWFDSIARHRVRADPSALTR